MLVTADKNLSYQQNLARLRIAVVVLPTNTLDVLLPLFPAIARAVANATAGSYVELPGVR